MTRRPFGAKSDDANGCEPERIVAMLHAFRRRIRRRDLAFTPSIVGRLRVRGTMPTAEEKFHKLLAAYEDEVQRKQHKMGKRVDPTDVPSPNPASGYCTFLRAGQQVIWSPSFEVIGTFDTSNNQWTWGWADQTLEPKIRTRVDEVRKQGTAWGIDLLTNGLLTLTGEAQAWELSTVATAISNADAMYRLVDGPIFRFLALFDGPPPSRSQSIRAPGSSASMPAVSVPASPRAITPYPGVASQRSLPASRVSNPNPALARQLTPMPVDRPNDKEPTDATRAELGRLLYMNMTTSQQAELVTLNLVARASPPTGPVGSASIDARLTLKPRNGPEQTLTASVALQEALVALWSRSRDRNGAPYRFVTARLETGPQGLVTNVFLEF
jgi:hypothetical protein